MTIRDQLTARITDLLAELPELDTGATVTRILSELSVEDHLAAALEMLEGVTPQGSGLKIAAEHAREALYQVRLWVIGQGV